jgi:hypothetical protein
VVKALILILTIIPQGQLIPDPAEVVIGILDQHQVLPEVAA